MSKNRKITAKKSDEKRDGTVSSVRKNETFKNVDSPVGQILNLQRTIGNQAVQRLFKSNVIQAKLKIGKPNDKYEKEADKVADIVMRMPEPKILRQTEPEEEEEPIQAKRNSSSTAIATPGIESGINSLKGGGQPLPESIRKYFKPRFGYDFSGVRVHADSKASETAKSINAKAFTKGKNIVFGAGQYSPETDTGKLLLAHELTHVLQQKNHESLKKTNLQHPYSVSDNSITSTIQCAREDEASYLQKRYGTKRRGVITFIMGKDTRDFYDYAEKYWSNKGRADRVVTSAHSFTEIIAYLRNNNNKPLFNKPWGEINIIVHGSELGAKMLIRRGGLEYTTIRALQEAINENTIRALPDTIVDDKTNINLHGCEIGQTKKLLHLISLAFGGADPKAPRVYAPKVFIGYGEKQQGGPYHEQLDPKFWVVIPKKNTTTALQKLRQKYSWLPPKQKRRISRRYITWESVAYNDRTASAIPRSQTIPSVNVQIYEVKLPGKNNLKAHAKIIRRFLGKKFNRYLPQPKGQLAKRTRSFDVLIKTRKILGNKIHYNVKYIFFQWQPPGKRRWKYPEGNWEINVNGDRSIPGDWKAKLKNWVGSQAYNQYAWKLKSQRKRTIWYGAQYNLTAEGTGFRATVAGLVEKSPSRSSRYFGSYKPKQPPRKRRK